MKRLLWGLPLLLTVAGGCSSEDDSGGTCPSAKPVSCVDGSGTVVGCCPNGTVCTNGGQTCDATAGAGGVGPGGAGPGGSGPGGAGPGGAGPGGSGPGGAGPGGSGPGGAGPGGAGPGGAGPGGAGGMAGTGPGGMAGTGPGGMGGMAGTGPGGMGGMGGAGGSGGTSGACADTGFEPNNSETNATSLGALGDCDGSNASFVQAHVANASDVDWYRYAGSDTGCFVDPEAEIDVDLRVCIFGTCDTGTTSISCAQGSPATSPDGHSGCCRSTKGKVELNLACGGPLTDENARIYMSVDDAGASQCTAYELKYHF